MDERQRFATLLPLARRLARYYEHAYRVRYGEFTTSAYVGAWKAAQTYEDDQDCTLESWGRTKIIGRIIDDFRDEMRHNGQGRKEHTRINTLSLERYISEDKTFEDILPCFEHGFDEIENHDLLMHLKPLMDPKEWDIMIRCVCNEETMKSVGKSYGVSESRICQILPVALRHARRIIERMNGA